MRCKHLMKLKLILMKTSSAILNKHAHTPTPLKTNRVKSNNQPRWMNDGIKVAITQQDSNHYNQNWNQYKYWRNQTTSLITRLNPLTERVNTFVFSGKEPYSIEIPPYFNSFL